MKLRLNKLVAGLVLAGSVVALVGCGGGDAPTLVVKSDVVTPITPATASTARTLVQAASGVQFPLPANLSFPNSAAGGSPATVPSGTQLQINAQPGATGSQLGGFALDAGPGNKVEGGLETGSCKFKVTSVTGVFVGLGWKVGDTFTQSPCTLTLQVNNAPLNSTVQAPIVLVLGSTNPLIGSATVEVTVEAGDDNSAVIKVGDTPVSEEPLPTGSPS